VQPTQPSLQWVSGTPAERENDHSPSFCSEVKNGLSSPSTLTYVIRLHCVVHSDVMLDLVRMASLVRRKHPQ